MKKMKSKKNANKVWLLLLVLSTTITSCCDSGERERVEGVITFTQHASLNKISYCVIRADGGLVKRVYGIWGEVGESIIIEDARTF